MNIKIPALPVDVLLVNVWPVNNVVSDGLICHIVRAANANWFVPGHLATETPERQQGDAES